MTKLRIANWHFRCSITSRQLIHDLRALGWQIDTQELPNKNTYYWLISKPAAKQLVLM